MSIGDTNVSAPPIGQRLRSRRKERGWSQAELAERAGISRAAVSAIEIDRLVPSVTAAMGLARALAVTVEDLFGALGAGAMGTAKGSEFVWAAEPAAPTCRLWRARVGARTILYPAELTAMGVAEHDGAWDGAIASWRPDREPDERLVIATCDPAAGLLAHAYERQTPFRLLALPRSSRDALSLLREGLVHVAGVHLAASTDHHGNGGAVARSIPDPCRLIRLVDWEEGLAVAPSVTAPNVGTLVRSRLTWIAREPGSGARACQDEIFKDNPSSQCTRLPARRVARDHRGVVEAIRSGWADVGVCVRLVSEETGLRFLPIRRESLDLCHLSRMEGDPRIRALQRVIQSDSFRRLLADLPGYHTTYTGQTQHAAP